MTLKEASAKALNIVEYEGDQLEIDFSEIGFDLDRPQLSLCPKCEAQVIKLSEGCSACPVFLTRNAIARAKILIEYGF